MKVDFAQCVNKGMQRDYSMDKSSQEFAYENKNIRITTTGDNTFLSVANEKSTTPVNIEYPAAGIKGTILGSVVIGDYLIVFSKADLDYIYRFNISGDETNFKSVILYEGNLYFSVDTPIECIASYEADDIQKVYWVDGINQPRVINVISDKYPKEETFDFVPKVSDNIDVIIEKQHDGAGVFPSGIIQYYVTFYKKFGPETNSIYQSPLYYISPSNRGGQADEIQTCSFKLTLTPKNKDFDYVRVYSLIRSSYNAEPTVSIVGDVNISSAKNLNQFVIIDTNINNIPVASTDIMFLGGNTIIASTIEQKDNTLFLGNISTKKEDVVSKIKKVSNKGNLEFCIKRSFIESSNNQYYPYAPEMDSSSINKTTFKYLEWYRFGLQVQLPTGEWSSTIYLQDLQNTIMPNSIVGNIPMYPPIETMILDEDSDEPTTKQEQYLTGVQFTISPDLSTVLSNLSITNWRLVVAEHNNNTRTVKAQGLVLPTIFNLEQRSKGTCYASPIWTLNTCLYGKHLMNIDPSGSTIPTAPKEEISVDLSAHSHINYVNNNYDISKGKLTQLSSVIDNVSEDISSGEGYYLSHIQPIIKIDRDYSTGYDNYEITIRLGIKDYSDPNTELWGRLNHYKANIEHIKNYNKRYGKRRKTLRTISEYLDNILWDEFLTTFENSDIPKYTFNLDNGSFDDGSTELNISSIYGCNKSAKVFNPGEIPTGDELRDDYGVKPANDVTITLSTYIRKATTTFESELINTYSNDYFLDANTCNFLSPDLENIQGSTKFRIIGSADITNSISDYEIKVKDNVLDGVYYTYAKHMLNNYKSSTTENSEVFNTGIKSFPLWPFNNKLYNINYWHPGGPIIKNVVSENGTNVDKYYFNLESKTFANMWVLGDNSYFDAINYGLAKEYAKIDNSSTIINGGIYKADYENLLVSKSNKNFAIPNSDEGVNETTPIEVIRNFIDNKNTILIDRKPSTTSIKHSTAPHGVFQLGKSHNLSNILPNYGNDISGGATMFGEVFPIGRVDVNNIWVVESDNIQGSIVDLLKLSDNTVKNNCSLRVSNKYVTYDEEGDIIEKEGPTHIKLVSPSWGDIEADEETGYLSLLSITKFNSYKLKVKDEYVEYNNVEILQDVEETYENIKSNIGYDSADISVRYSNNDILLLLFESDGGDDKQPVGILLKGVTVSQYSNIYSLYIDRVELLKDEVLSKCVIKVESEEYLFDKLTKNVGNVKNLTTYSSKTIPSTSKLLIGEFYIDYDKSSFMGGANENAIELNTFIPISGVYNPIVSGESVVGYGLEGDTYYQRWDYVRIYPSSDTDVNKPIDALSMMVETYKNLDGDYRKLRGRLDAINLTTENTNTTINEVYSQPNNYMTSSVLDDKFNDSTHPTMYTWSLTKQPLAEIDNWTKINLINANKLDGDKGNLTKIKRWNNSLFAFQDKAIAIINFNQQTALSTSNGVPVEIANSGKVSGHYYLTTNQGCKNKWSIAESPYGLYFIDSYNKAINILGDGIKNLSSLHLFDDWVRQNEKGCIWYPSEYTDGFRSIYDPINKEVYFVNKETALCYNEVLGQFTSFYDYQNTSDLAVLGNHIYGIKPGRTNSKIYLMFEGEDYCNLYDIQRDYYMTYKINKDPFIDKTWTNIEYRADIFNSGNIANNNANKITPETFDTLKVWDEYQSGISNLMEGKYPNAKVKFRIWRADIPRDTKEGKGLNRIRNPWTMLELRKSTNTNKRMEFHDLLIKYLS